MTAVLAVLVLIVAAVLEISGDVKIGRVIVCEGLVIQFGQSIPALK